MLLIVAKTYTVELLYLVKLDFLNCAKVFDWELRVIFSFLLLGGILFGIGCVHVDVCQGLERVIYLNLCLDLAHHLDSIGFFFTQAIHFTLFKLVELRLVVDDIWDGSKLALAADF